MFRRDHSHMNPSQFNFKDDFLNQFFTCMGARMINDLPPCDKSLKKNLVTGRVPTDYTKKASVNSRLPLYNENTTP